MTKRNRLYRIFYAMKTRCYNPNHKSYHLYGGRGIKICDEWNNNYNIFKEWALNNGYSDTLTIDRIDVNGDYEPSNCRWISIEEQQVNRRNTNRFSVNNEILSLRGISHKYKIPTSYIKKHLDKGFGIEEIIDLYRKKSQINIDGNIGTISDLARIYGINNRTVKYRLARGWSLYDAITKPVDQRFTRKLR